MKITMKATRLGSPNGYDVKEYMAGETYDVPADLAAAFIGSNAALPAVSKPSGGKNKPQSDEKPSGGN